MEEEIGVIVIAVSTITESLDSVFTHTSHVVVLQEPLSILHWILESILLIKYKDTSGQWYSTTSQAALLVPDKLCGSFALFTSLLMSMITGDHIISHSWLLHELVKFMAVQPPQIIMYYLFLNLM
jgi:hypothetical protein